MRRIAPPSARDLDLSELGLVDPVGDLDVTGDADPELFRPALLAPPPLLVAQLVVAGRAEHEVQRPLVVPRVVCGVRHRRVGERVLRDEVPPPHLGWIHRELGRERVDRTLDRLRRLWPARSPEGRDRSRVRRHRATLEFDPRDRVDAARHQRCQVRQERSERTDTHRQSCKRLEPVGEHLAVASPTDREVEALRTTVHERDHALAARLRPAHRAAELARQPGDQQLLDAGHLRAEAATDVAGDHAHLRRLEPEDPGEQIPVLVGRLRREPGGEPAIRASSAAHERGSSGHGAIR